MKKRRKLKQVVLIMFTMLTMLGSSIGVMAAQTSDSEEGKESGGGSVPDTAFEVVEDMGIGWNLGNSLDAMVPSKGYNYNSETFWNNPVVTKELIDTVAAQGYGAIRVPVSWYNHIDENGKIDEKWLARVAEVVNYCLDNDLYVIINVHHDAGMDKSYQWIYADVSTYDEDCKNLINLWSQIATYFKDFDERLLFEATNEIMNHDSNWDWGVSWDDFQKVHDLDQEFINTVRATGGKNASRYLVVSTWGASSDSCQIEQLFYKSFEDTIPNHLIVSVHNYMTSSSQIQYVISKLKTYSDKYNVPFILDEFGSKSDVSLETRIAAATEIVSTAKAVGITCFWWDNGGDYALFDRWNNNKLFYPTLVEAMLNAAGVKKDTHEHTIVIDKAVEATCKSEGKTEGSHCSVCNEVIKVQEIIAKKAHTEVEDKAVEATCKSEGKTEGSHCSVCNEVIVAQKTVAKKEHTVVIDKPAEEATCKEEGKTVESHCSVCKEVLQKQETVAKKEHTVVQDKAVEPTTETEGKTAGSHCSVCNEVIKAQEVIPKLESGTTTTTGWVTKDGKNYYVKEDGTNATGWLQLGDSYYYLNSDGVMQTGWVKIAKKWYYLNSDGIMQTGWVKDGKNWYYLSGNGSMKTGWFKEGNTWYYLGSSGTMATGWVKDGGRWYYLSGSGAMQVGWIKVGGTWYYLGNFGNMVTGWFKESNVWYYLNDSGAMLNGWQQIKGKWYYFYPSGKMAANTKIGSYFVNANGEWVK
ncbi:MAG: cellulase family glycosylhydrolase [Lachnospiraceae bacterium]|nr:cellulase family glycosylhydrolase [Lachnospiraceae bacterium]